MTQVPGEAPRPKSSLIEFTAFVSLLLVLAKIIITEVHQLFIPIGVRYGDASSNHQSSFTWPVTRLGSSASCIRLRRRIVLSRLRPSKGHGRCVAVGGQLYRTHSVRE